MGSVREDIAQQCLKDDLEQAPCLLDTWEKTSEFVRESYRRDAAQILSLVCKRIEGVENPYPITRYNDPRYLDKPVHDAFEKARQAILDVIKEE